MVFVGADEFPDQLVELETLANTAEVVRQPRRIGVALQEQPVCVPYVGRGGPVTHGGRLLLLSTTEPAHVRRA